MSQGLRRILHGEVGGEHSSAEGPSGASGRGTETLQETTNVAHALPGLLEPVSADVGCASPVTSPLVTAEHAHEEGTIPGHLVDFEGVHGVELPSLGFNRLDATAQLLDLAGEADMPDLTDDLSFRANGFENPATTRTALVATSSWA